MFLERRQSKNSVVMFFVIFKNSWSIFPKGVWRHELRLSILIMRNKMTWRFLLFSDWTQCSYLSPFRSCGDYSIFFMDIKLFSSQFISAKTRLSKNVGCYRRASTTYTYLLTWNSFDSDVKWRAVITMSLTSFYLSSLLNRACRRDRRINSLGVRCGRLLYMFY